MAYLFEHWWGFFLLVFLIGIFIGWFVQGARLADHAENEAAGQRARNKALENRLNKD